MTYRSCCAALVLALALVGAGHGFAGPAIARTVAAFFDKQLKK